jgi:hypothetical protein
MFGLHSVAQAGWLGVLLVGLGVVGGGGGGAEDFDVVVVTGGLGVVAGAPLFPCDDFDVVLAGAVVGACGEPPPGVVFVVGDEVGFVPGGGALGL